jgi:protein-disulfide isomerase
MQEGETLEWRNQVMDKTNHKQKYSWAFLLALTLALLLAACGPSANESDRVGQGLGDAAASLPGDDVFANGEIPMGFTDDGHAYMGNLNASVVIEEFSDFQCPFCGRFAQQTFPELKKNQIARGELLFIYRDFPLSSHPQATPAANAARCAGEQSPAFYWTMHDKLFENISEWSSGNPNAVFARYGQSIEGLDLDPFTACLESERYYPAIQADFNEGRARGVTSTPSFFINEQALIGAQPISVFNQAIAAVQAGEPIAGNQPSAPDLNEPIVAPTPIAPQPQAAATLGNPNAPVTIVEFSDYQCPFCRRHALETMPYLKELIDAGRVYYMFKDLPLDSIHPEARRIAAAARCAGEQDAYWEMHNAIFELQERWVRAGAGIDGMMSNLAVDLGLNRANFDSCLNSGRHEAAVQENYAEATSLGIQGTPYFLINGYPLNGALPAQVFEFAIGLAEEGELGQALAEAAAEQRRQQQLQQQQQQPQPPTQQDVPIGDAYYIGDPNAPITVIEYTNFQCSFCQRHAKETLPLIIQNYVETGQVLYVFKDFPLISIHPQAVKAAEAARCAREQGQYLAMHDILFSRMGEWSGRADAADLFMGYGAELGLGADFASCLAGGRHEAGVMADLSEGAGFGVTGTPGFFINGYLLSGAYPYDTFVQIFDSLLAEEGR